MLHRKSSWPDYRAVWRWHFYAGLFCIPFVIILSLTGALYLYRPQLEPWLDRSWDEKVSDGIAQPVATQFQAALATFPQAKPSAYLLPEIGWKASRFLVMHEGKLKRVYVDPHQAQVLGWESDDSRFFNWLKRLHGQLLMGTRGSNLVELASSWTIVMLATGLFLWWPRSHKGWGGILYPRWRSGPRRWMRDLHGVTGFWIAAFAFFLLATGLPWAKFWGSYFRQARALVGADISKQDWTLGGQSAGDHAGHTNDSNQPKKRKGGFRRSSGGIVEHWDHLERVVSVADSMQLAPPVLIEPPGKSGGPWTIKAESPNRLLRRTTELDAATGQVVSEERFAQKHWIDQAVSAGIAAHEGQLFGPLNQLLGLLTALGLLLLSLSGLWMWWRRRIPGTLGAPVPLVQPRIQATFVLLFLLLSLYIPMFGASALLVAILERFVLSRNEAIRQWLSLGPLAHQDQLPQ
jgi:uncharacterized iron-regulated membrane protein